MKDRILVTGGAGFIGSHLVRELLGRGHDVTIVDNLSMGLRSNVPPDARFVEADIEDEERMLELMRSHRIDRVCHLAARVSIRASTTGFCEDARTNIMGSLSLLRAVTQTDVAKVVFASSMAVYADSPSPKPIAESYSTEPVSPYGISKLAGEKFVSNILDIAGRKYSVLRLFNTYGSGQTYTPYVGVITIFATKLLKGETPQIFGDGNQVRDFVYVGDVAQAFRRAVEFDGASGIYNVGSGRPRTVNEVARLLQARIDPNVPLAWAPAAAGEIRNSIADISQARSSLGYSPLGDLEAKIDEVVDAVRARIPSLQAVGFGR